MIWRLRPVIFLPAIPQHVENSVQNLAHVNRALRPPGLAGGIIGSTTAIRRRSDHSDNEEHCGQQQCDVQASTGPPRIKCQHRITTDSSDATTSWIASRLRLGLQSFSPSF